MLEKKVDCKLAATIVEAATALEKAGTEGALLSLSASWHRTVESGKEVVDMAEFAFLLADGGKPVQLQVDYENGKFAHDKQDLSKEMGDVGEEEAFVRGMQFITDADVLLALEKDPRVEKVRKKAKHLRVYSMDFVVYDEDYKAPVWHVLLKNWPLTNHFKREEPITVEAVVEATRGKIATLAVYH